MHGRCVKCGGSKKTTRSRCCHTCARREQHKSGVYSRSKIDPAATERWCSFCQVSHPWKYGQSSDFWLLRKLKPHHSYECRIRRKFKYDQRRKDPHKRLRKAVSNLLRDCLAKHDAYKDDSFVKYVDWTVSELKQYLESLWQPGMSWDNYGRNGWHIDHIVPDSWFTYSSPHDEGFKQSWSLSNLQPMWESDNCSKSNRYRGYVNGK